MTKSADDHFADWHGHVFPYGYGSGEGHIVPALKAFLDAVPAEGNYDYATLETAVGPTVAWLLINALCRHGVDVFEYGTSPRFGWLTAKGRALKRFIDSKTVEELVQMATADHDACYPDACHCGPHGYEKGKICPNPFFHDKFALEPAA